MGGILGGLANMLPSLPGFSSAGMNYGIFRRMRDDYASQVRHLRRREYQDMVFSMKQAGLNPILAAGATPGHSAALMAGQVTATGSAGVGSAVAANRQAGIAEKRQPMQTKKDEEEAMLKRVNQGTLLAQGDNLASATALNRALEAKAKADATTSTALGMKYMSETGTLDASAKEIAERTRGIQYLNEVKQLEADLSNLPEAEWLKRIQAWSSAIQGGASAAHSAKGVRR